MSKISTRSLTESSLFGMPMKFSVNQLPTKTDVHKHYLHSRDNIQSSSKAKHSVREVCKLVLTDLISFWKRAGIPTGTKNSLLKRLLLLVDEATKLLRYQKSRRNSATFLELKANFGNLLDICSCKCVGKK